MLSDVESEDASDLTDYLVESLVGTSDPAKLVQALGYASMEEMLVENRATSLAELLLAPLEHGTFFWSNMTRLRLEMEAVKLGYRNRHAFCDSSWPCGT